MDRDQNTDGVDFNRMGLKPVLETDSDASDNDGLESDEEQSALKRKRR